MKFLTQILVHGWAAEDDEEIETIKSVRKLPVAEAAAIMRQRLEIEASQSFYTSNDFEEGWSGLWASEVAQLDSVKSLKAKSYALKAQYQAKVKELARAREELAKLNAAGDNSLYQSQND